MPLLRVHLLLLLLGAPAFAGGNERVVVVLTNDLHGQMEPLPPSPLRPFLQTQQAGGYAHEATMIRAARREAAEARAHFLLLDAGDIYQGTPIGNETRGEAVIAAMNTLDYDAMALGNHEFDYGVGNVVRLVRQAKFPVLAANASGVREVKPYVLLAPPRVPCRIAVIGLITTETPHITGPGATKGVRFSDPVEATRAIMKEVEADLFIVVSHIGRDADLKLAAQVDGIALIAGGHSHTPVNDRVNGTLVLQTHAKSLSLARADLTLDPNGWKVVDAKGRLLPVDPRAAPADPAVTDVIGKYGKDLDARLKEVVGELLGPARRDDGTAGNWMADVIRSVGKAEIGFTNRGGVRADLEKGPVTRADCYRLMPFDNDVVSMDLTGKEIRGLLDRNFAGATSPYRLDWSGLVVDVEGTGGTYRVVAVEAGGKPLEDGRTYRVATNSFLAAGGDGFETFRRGKNTSNAGVLIRDALANDLLERSPLMPPPDPRVRVLESAR
ncbi:MAG TPA: bifunctional UDP-sugar hydrolase/5'-nucleotidase [Planctomycetota bacterium]|nr:bifunctional UDP-sugar hydrolase/5'-nucleotidase [Planctomycetota bacterium]